MPRGYAVVAAEVESDTLLNITASNRRDSVRCLADGDIVPIYAYVSA